MRRNGHSSRRLSPSLSTTTSESVAAGIARCAAVLEDLTLLRDEVGELRKHDEQTAQFATALFDLERARRGDPDARMQLLEVADSLLVFWRERTGDALADSHPVLAPLWAHASALLVSFEVKRFKRALDACWEARTDAALLQVAIEGLLPVGNRRVEFAACLYHLELARLFVDSSRKEFARRASLVHEAYHSKEIADELVGDDPGLQHLWKELVPYLDEFFEALEAEQERKLRSNLKTDPGGEAAVARGPVPPPPDITPVHGVKKADPLPPPEAVVAPEAPSVDPDIFVVTEAPMLAEAPTEAPLEAPVAVTFVGPAPTRKPSTEEVDRTDPSAKAVSEPIDLTVPPPPPPPSMPDSSGVFDLWLQEPNKRISREMTPVPAVIESIEEVLEPLPSGPPPPPSNFTPAPNTLFAVQMPDPDVTAPRPPPPPPPSANLAANQSGIFELNDLVEEEPPPPPPRPSRPSLDVETGDDYEPDAATQTFWRHTEESLGLLPPAEQPRMDRRALSADGRAERKKLNGWLDGVTRRFNTVPEAKTFACLMKLYMAAQLKEKGLFGGANAKRKEAFVAALELLSAEPLAAGHCAVWFELDGKETLEHLGNGLEVLTDYLQFCARQNLDPLDPAVPAQFMA